MPDFEFVYNANNTIEENFRHWYQLNAQERGVYNEQIMSIDQAREVFSKYFGVDFG